MESRNKKKPPRISSRHKNSARTSHVCKCGRTERYSRNKRCIFVAVFPELFQTVTQSMFMAAHTETQCLSCSASYRTAHLLHKYCTNCTVCNWTVLTVITQKLLLHVQLHNSTQTVSWCLLKCSAAGCLILYLIDTHLSRNQVLQSNSHYCKRPARTSHRYTTLAYFCVRRQQGGWNSQLFSPDTMT